MISIKKHLDEQKSALAVRRALHDVIDAILAATCEHAPVADETARQRFSENLRRLAKRLRQQGDASETVRCCYQGEAEVPQPPDRDNSRGDHQENHGRNRKLDSIYSYHYRQLDLHKRQKPEQYAQKLPPSLRPTPHESNTHSSSR